MRDIAQIIDYAEQHCTAHGVRLTDKRKRVLASLLQSKHALSAYELVDVCKSDYGETLPVMSVYRILDFWVEENFVHRLELANKYIACEHIECDHEHEVPQFLICKSCSKVKEVNVSRAAIKALHGSVEGAGYMLISNQLEMSCLCDDCVKEVN